MRLSSDQVNQIKWSVQQVFGEQASVWLFGSRVNDHAKGGDIDLFIKTDQSLSNPAWMAAKLAVKVMRFQQGRKVDVVVQAANSTPQQIFEIAKKTGVLL